MELGVQNVWIICLNGFRVHCYLFYTIVPLLLVNFFFELILQLTKMHCEVICPDRVHGCYIFKAFAYLRLVFSLTSFADAHWAGYSIIESKYFCLKMLSMSLPCFLSCKVAEKNDVTRQAFLPLSATACPGPDVDLTNRTALSSCLLFRSLQPLRQARER